ncbi:sterol desaturase family protein [uncultured Thiohalocapsa sp.]|uniref:sterol desaturase family protein n=1 Tax=uncultured Thiohalocapsa sp. TaxID=768990 RepID=UPI0025F46040|nr:sterol desaturase family protein [uncultured Thiohalocapsa sp.]
MSIDTIIGLIALVALFAAEGFLPAYAGREQRLRHGAENLALAAMSAAVAAVAAPLLVLSVEYAAARDLGLCHALGLGWPACAALTFVLFDLWMYAWHRANHQVPFLWRFHRVHHTDPAMDSTTALRFHPGEILLSTLANCLVLMALGMSLGMLVLYKTVMVLVILFHHSNLDVPARLDARLRRIIVPPSMHRVHHSAVRAETDSNYGTVFSLWDRLFRSFRLRDDPEAIRFGIGAYDEAAWQRPLRLLRLPLEPNQSRTATGADGPVGAQS